jgi:hypothetical protein
LLLSAVWLLDAGEWNATATVLKAMRDGCDWHEQAYSSKSSSVSAMRTEQGNNQRKM